MDNLILSLNIVMPLFICMAVGYFLRQIKMVDEKILNAINKLCFKVFLPLYLMENVYTTDLQAAFDPWLILFSLGGLLVIFLLLVLIIPRIEKDNTRRGVVVQGIFRSNFALFGLPLAISLCGEGNIGPTSLLIGILVPLYNVLAVIALEGFRGGKPNVKKMVKGIVTNPLILATLLGVVLNLLHIDLPYILDKSVSDLGKIATPLSLVALGGTFTFEKVRKYLKQLTIVVTGKLIIIPVIMMSLAVLLGFRKEDLVPIMIMFAAPTAVSSFPMAQQMDGDAELAAQIIVFTSAIAIFTIFVWIFLLKQFGFIL